MKFHVFYSRIALVLSLLIGAPGAEAASKSSNLAVTEIEPSYCDPAKFDETEIPLEGGKERTSSLARAHAFRLGKVTLVGLGVGDSPVKDVIELSKRLAPGSKASNYCTWYLNHAKSEKDLNKKLAETTFVHRDIEKNPIALTEEEASTIFMKTLLTSFDQDTVNFISCASEQNYLALGCNEMMHRGPTVFGMILAFSGCSPSHSLEIVDQTWGLNHVKRKVRLAVIQKAYQLGQDRKDSRKRLSEAFLSH
ncbi:MAG: hypothetical protein ABIQ95_01960 [Bdellovibrionia bacterium]